MNRHNENASANNAPTTARYHASRAIERRIDQAITEHALTALYATGGRDHFEVAEVVKQQSGWGTGYVTELVPADPTDPAYVARKQIVFLLLDPELNLIGNSMLTPNLVNSRSVVIDTESRLAEMLERQVMRPADDGGLNLRMAASESVSVVGWARKLLVGRNGAPKIAARVSAHASSRAAEMSDVRDMYAAGLGGQCGSAFDVEAVVDTVGLRHEVAGIVKARAKALAAANTDAEWSRTAAAVVTESFDLPDASAAHLDADAARELLVTLEVAPELALASMNVHAGANGHAPVELVRMWAAYTRQHVHLVRCAQHGQAWAALLARAALHETLAE